MSIKLHCHLGEFIQLFNFFNPVAQAKISGLLLEASI